MGELFGDEVLVGMISIMRQNDPYAFIKFAISGAETKIKDAQKFCPESGLIDQLIDSKAKLIQGVERGDSPESLSTLQSEVRILSMKLYYLLVEIPESPYAKFKEC